MDGDDAVAPRRVVVPQLLELVRQGADVREARDEDEARASANDEGDGDGAKDGGESAFSFIT